MLILSVDDDSDDREIFCDAITAIDAQVCCSQVDSGSAALEFLSKAEILPDYVFIDVNMPKMNGYECVEHIRSVPRLKNIQLVMYSTAFKPTDLGNFSKQGIKHLVKQSTFPDLVKSIKHLILDGVTVLEEGYQKVVL